MSLFCRSLKSLPAPILTSFHLAPQAAGLWAISAGLSYNYRDDHEMLAIGMKVYDALYSWAKYVQNEKHTWSPSQTKRLKMESPESKIFTS